MEEQQGQFHERGGVLHRRPQRPGAPGPQPHHPPVGRQPRPRARPQCRPEGLRAVPEEARQRQESGAYRVRE